MPALQRRTATLVWICMVLAGVSAMALLLVPLGLLDAVGDDEPTSIALLSVLALQPLLALVLLAVLAIAARRIDGGQPVPVAVSGTVLACCLVPEPGRPVLLVLLQAGAGALVAAAGVRADLGAMARGDRGSWSWGQLLTLVLTQVGLAALGAEIIGVFVAGLPPALLAGALTLRFVRWNRHLRGRDVAHLPPGPAVA